jgi:hypothetical protein
MPCCSCSTLGPRYINDAGNSLCKLAIELDLPARLSIQPLYAARPASERAAGGAAAFTSNKPTQSCYRRCKLHNTDACCCCGGPSRAGAHVLSSWTPVLLSQLLLHMLQRCVCFFKPPEGMPHQTLPSRDGSSCTCRCSSSGTAIQHSRSQHVAAIRQSDFWVLGI